MSSQQEDNVFLDMLNEKGMVPYGKPVYVKTVTHYYTGEIVALTPQWLIVKNAARIVYDAPTGRHESEFCNGEVEPPECEYMGPGLKFIGVGAIVEFQEVKKIVMATR